MPKNCLIITKFGIHIPWSNFSRHFFSVFGFSSPFPPWRGPCPHPPGTTYQTNWPISIKFGTNVFTYVGIDWHCKNFDSPPVPPPPPRGAHAPPGGLFELINQFWLNLTQMALKNFATKYQYNLWLNSDFGHISNAHACCYQFIPRPLPVHPMG